MDDLGSSLPAPRLTSSLDPGFRGPGAQSELNQGIWDEKVLLSFRGKAVLGMRPKRRTRAGTD